MTNPKAGDIRTLIHWYTFLHGGKIAPDDTQVKGKLLRLLHAIGGRIETTQVTPTTTPARAIPPGVDIGEYPE
jgi:hypothetical protein